MRAISHPSPNEHGNGRNTQESEKRRVLLGGYRLVHSFELDEGERRQAGNGTLIETPTGDRFVLWVDLEQGDT